MHSVSFPQFHLTRYFAVTSFTVILPVLILTSWLYARNVNHNLELDHERASIGMANRLSNVMMEEMMGDNSAEILPIIHNAKRLNPTLQTVLLYDAAGKLLYGSLPNWVDTSEQGAFIIATHNKHTQTTHLYNPTNDMFEFRTGVAIFDESERLMGSLVIFEALPSYQEGLQRAKLAGLTISGVAMGTLAIALFFIVRRADKLIISNHSALQEAYRDLQSAETRRDDLTNMIVHDLRSPLTAVNINLDLLQRTNGYNPQRTQKYIDRASIATSTMVTLINDMLDVTKLQQDTLTLQATCLDISELLYEQTLAFESQAEQQHKHITLLVAPNLPEVYADRDLIQRVLGNLISNALRYTRAGDQIRLVASVQNDQLLVQVGDEGVGISAENIPTIFDKFVQGKAHNEAPRRRGAGLGLAFCRLAIEAHGGHIWVESEVDHGSIFQFTLPLDPVQAGVQLVTCQNLVQIKQRQPLPQKQLERLNL